MYANCRFISLSLFAYSPHVCLFVGSKKKSELTQKLFTQPKGKQKDFLRLIPHNRISIKASFRCLILTRLESSWSKKDSGLMHHRRRRSRL